MSAGTRYLRLLALFALIMQLVASFGHVHLKADHAFLAASTQCEATAEVLCTPPTHDEDEDNCPTCQAMSRDDR